MKLESNNTMPLNAVEIRLTRLLPSGEIREYEAVTWDRPFESCWRWLNHANAVGFIANRGEEYGRHQADCEEPQAPILYRRRDPGMGRPLRPEQRREHFQPAGDVRGCRVSPFDAGRLDV